MGKRIFNMGDKAVSKREPEKKGVIIGYYKKTGEYQLRLESGEIHYEAPRWLEKVNN